MLLPLLTSHLSGAIKIKEEHLDLVIVIPIISRSAVNLLSAHWRLQMWPKGRHHQQTAGMPTDVSEANNGPRVGTLSYSYPEIMSRIPMRLTHVSVRSRSHKTVVTAETCCKSLVSV